MSAEVRLASWQGVRRTGDGRWIARCPAHDDRRPSLSIRELDDGRVLIHCFADCSVEKAVTAAGLKIQELFTPQPLSGNHSHGERRPFFAADVLAALADEALLVAVAAANLACGVKLS